MILRPALPADAAAVAALEKELFGVDAWSATAVLDELTGENRFAVAAVDGDATVGYAVTAAAGGLVDLQRIAVAAPYRRRGAASRLLDAGLEHARERRAEAMLLEVSAHNHGAVAFYTRAGFAQIGRRRRYYRDGSDALVMRLALTGPTSPGPRPAERG